MKTRLLGLALIAVTGCADDSMRASMESGGATPGGSQDAGFFRATLRAGGIPRAEDITMEGFLGEHDISYADANCEQVLCLAALVGRDRDVAGGGFATLVQLAMASNVDLDARPRAPVNLGVVVDVSGSMAEASKLEYVKQGLAIMVGELDAEDRLALVTYSSTADVIIPSQPVGDGSVFLEAITALHPAGATNLYDGMVLGYEQVLANLEPGVLPRVMLLSDGLANTGVSAPASILATSAEYNDQGLGITTIGVGLDFNQELMRELAEQGGGNFYFIEDPAKLTTVFKDELGFLVTPLANDLRITMTPGEGFSLADSHGLAYTLDETGAVVVSVPTVFASRSKGAVLLRLEAEDPSLALEGQPVVAVSYSFLPIGDDGTVQAEISRVVDARMPALDDEGAAFAHAAVRKALVLWNMVQSFQAASDAYYLEGAQSTAVEHITALAAYVDAANEVLADAELARDREELVNQFAVNLGGYVGDPRWDGGEPMPMDHGHYYQEDGVFFPFGCAAAAHSSLVAALPVLALLRRPRARQG